MRLVALPVLASLLFARGATRAPATPALSPLAVEPPAEQEEVAEPLPEVAFSPPPPTVREIGAPVPKDVVASVRVGKSDARLVQLRRKGYLVSLRSAGARSAGLGEAALSVPAGTTEPVVWETTRIDTLATVRGTLRIEGAGSPRAALKLAEAPAPAGRAEGQLHMCAAHEDGAGGFTVLCRIRSMATAANVTGDDARDVYAVGVDGATLVRMDLPVSPSGFAASVVGYPVGADGVVLRAEASRVAGEDRPVLTMLAAERPQPQVPRVAVEYRCKLLKYDF